MFPASRPTVHRGGGSDAPAEALRWQVEMHELVRDMQGELDTKMRLLQLLIEQARVECERLQHLLKETKRSLPQ